jgi:hypothetical protein
MGDVVMDKHIAHIETLCWSFSMGGEHYTAKAECGDESIDKIEYNLSRSQALSLNKKDSSLGISQYKVGEKSYRFFEEKEAVVKGVEACLGKWKELKIIIHGSSATAQPQPVVWCVDGKIKNGINKLSDKMKKLYKEHRDPWTSHEKTMDRLCDKWNELLEKLT